MTLKHKKILLLSICFLVILLFDSDYIVCQSNSKDSINLDSLLTSAKYPFWQSQQYYSKESTAKDKWNCFLYFLGSEVIATAAHFLPQYGLAKAFGAKDAKLNFWFQKKDNKLWVEFFNYDPNSITRTEKAILSSVGFGMNQLIYEYILYKMNRNEISEDLQQAMATLAFIARLDLPNIIFWDYSLNRIPIMNDPKNFREALGIPNWPIVVFTIAHLAIDFPALIRLFNVVWGNNALIGEESAIKSSLKIENNALFLNLSFKFK